MSSPSIIELKPVRALLDPQFEGYKCTFKVIPVLKSSINQAPKCVCTNDNQYSFLHAKLFSLHNHLSNDPWLANSVYFIDDDLKIQNVRYNESTGVLSAVTAVHKIARTSRPLSDPYNASFSFISQKYCVFSEGNGDLSIFDTNDRVRNAEWKTVFSDAALEPSHPFIIRDARSEIVDGQIHIHCLLLSIHRNEESEFYTFIDWVVLKNDSSNQWSRHHVRQLKGKSLPEYCQLEPKCKAILLSADGHFEFTFDTEHPIFEDKETPNEMNIDDPDENAEKFIWNQGDEDVDIHFNIPRGTTKQNVKIVCDCTKLQVWLKDDMLLDADLLEEVDKDLTTWNLANETLEITLAKKEPSIEWTSLLKDRVIAPSSLSKQQIRGLALPHANIRTEMEDCDYGEFDLDTEYSFVRLDAITHKTTHKVNLGVGNPVLFTLNLGPNKPLALVTRYDTDAIVWYPNIHENADGDAIITMRHEGTLKSIGYVQASKKAKKYFECSPNMHYTIICDGTHLMYYNETYDSSSELINRNSRQKVNIGQMQAMRFEDSDEILGILCQNEATILLTRKQILCLQLINESAVNRNQGHEQNGSFDKSD